ncbi:glycosyltransferase family protein [Pseudoalteromonas xiamenensis]
MLIIGPYYMFRNFFVVFPRYCYFYVADSVLKTSLYAFFSNPFLLHRVLFNYIAERRLKGKNIIVASEEEYNWFSSAFNQLKNIFLVNPVPYISSGKGLATRGSNESEKIRVLVLNPNGAGIELLESILALTPPALENKIEFVITGGRINLNQSRVLTNVLAYVDDLDALIASSDLVVLTDIGGSGLCNRAVQARKLGKRILSTLSGIRGTGLYRAEGVYIFDDAASFYEQLDNILFLSRNISAPDVYYRAFLRASSMQFSNLKNSIKEMLNE